MIDDSRIPRGITCVTIWMANREVALHVGKLMEIVTDGSTTDYRHYVGDVAIVTKTGALNDPDPAIRYLHRDRLGSPATITDETGQIVESRAYGAFGKPRHGDFTDKTPAVIGSDISNRGFTGHEHLDDLELIHMNGRAYDYHLGRFLSVDPFIQEPGNSQSLNPYSYIMNNPLAGTDPSGYCATTDTRRDCRDSLKTGVPQKIKNTDGDVVGYAGKDEDGNLYLASNGSSGGKGAISNAIEQGFSSIDEFGSHAQIAAAGGDKGVQNSGPTQSREIGHTDHSQGTQSSPLQGSLASRYDPGDDFYHSYGGPGEGDWAICQSPQPFCTQQRAYDSLLYFAFPGQDNSIPVEHLEIYKIKFAGLSAGHIQVQLEPSTFSVFNITRPDHDLHDGYVRRSVVWKGQTLYLRTFGEGNNRNFIRWAQNVALWRPGFNQYNYQFQQHLIQTWLGDQN